MPTHTAPLPTPPPEKLSQTQRHIKKIQSDRRAAEAWVYLDAKVRSIVGVHPLARDVPVDTEEEDLVSAVLAQLLVSIAAFKVEPTASFSGWVSTIVTRKVNSLWRRARARRRDIRRTVSLDDLDGFDVAEDDPLDPSLLSCAEEMQKRAERAVDQLCARDRRVLSLREDSGLSFREIGEALGGAPANTARSVFHRARKRRARTLRAGFGVKRARQAP